MLENLNLPFSPDFGGPGSCQCYNCGCYCMCDLPTRDGDGSRLYTPNYSTALVYVFETVPHG